MTHPVAAHDGKVETVPARTGKGVRLAKGESVKLINTYGLQVVDTWAFNSHDLGERMSMEHTRAHLNKIMPSVGDTFVTNRRSKILTIIEDTSPGHHDILMAACDVHRYKKQYGLEQYHDNCADNLRNALRDLGEKGEEFAPAPFNIWMNIPTHPDGTLSWELSTAQAGQYITLKAEMDLIIVFSACPNDVIAINGNKSSDVHYVVLEA